jgi:hypothetical protein
LTLSIDKSKKPIQKQFKSFKLFAPILSETDKGIKMLLKIQQQKLMTRTKKIEVILGFENQDNLIITETKTIHTDLYLPF